MKKATVEQILNAPGLTLWGYSCEGSRYVLRMNLFKMRGDLTYFALLSNHVVTCTFESLEAQGDSDSLVIYDSLEDYLVANRMLS